MFQKPNAAIEKWVSNEKLKSKIMCENDEFVENKSDEISSPKLVLYLAKAMVSGHLIRWRESRTQTKCGKKCFTIKNIFYDWTF